MTEQEQFAVPTLPPAGTSVGTPVPPPPPETPLIPPTTDEAAPSVAPLPTLPGPAPIDAQAPLPQSTPTLASPAVSPSFERQPVTTPTLGDAPTLPTVAPVPPAPATPVLAPGAVIAPAPTPVAVPAVPLVAQPDPAASDTSGQYLDKYGMPVAQPDGPQTVANWKKKRKKSPARKLIGAVVMFAILGGIGYGAYLGYEQLAPEAAPPPTLPLDDPDTLIGRSNELTNQINENSEELEALEQLGLDPTGEPVDAAGPVVQSYSFLWTDTTGSELRIGVDIATNDFTMTDGTLTLRRIGNAIYSQASVDGSWSEVAFPADIAAVGLMGPLTLTGIVPDEIAPWIASGSEVSAGRLTYTIDEARLAAEAPELWQSYLAPWGLTDVAAATAAPGRDLSLVIQVDPGGQVVSATMDSPSIGGSVSYTLISMSDVQLAVETPTINS